MACAETLALHIQAVLQGAFVLAKGRQHPQPAIDCVDHLHRYVELPCSQTTRKKHLR
jgi:TetR/AcrR family transcriptional repressor of nem operon